MALFAYKCRCGREFEQLRSASEPVRTSKCPRCGDMANQNYQAKKVQVGMVDGETTGFFPPSVGPYAEPGKSLKRVCKNKRAWNEMLKKSEGKIGDAS